MNGLAENLVVGCRSAEESTWCKYKRVLEKIRSAKTYRRKFSATLMVYLTFFSFEELFSLQGATSPALRLMVKVDLQTFSWLFTVCFLGYLIGSGLHGILHNRIANGILLTKYGVLSGICTIATPWCSNFILMVFVRFVTGVAFGGIDTALHDQLFSIWGKESAPFTQFQYTMVGLGGTFSSLVLAGLLKSTATNNAPQNVTISHFNVGSNLTGNMTKGLSAEEESQVKTAFLLSGCLAFISVVPYVIEYIMYSKEDLEAYLDEYHKTKSSDDAGNGNRYVDVRLISVCIMLCIIFAVQGLNTTIHMYLTIFVTDNFDTEMEKGEWFTVAYYVAAVFGSCFFMALSLIICTTAILLTCILGAVVCFIALLLSSLYLCEIGALVSVICCGLFLMPMWPAMFTFIEEKISPFSGRIAALCLVSGGLGMIFHPVLFGYTMNSLSPMWFIYISLIEWLVILCMFSGLIYSVKHKNSYERFPN